MYMVDNKINTYLNKEIGEKRLVVNKEVNLFYFF